MSRAIEVSYCSFKLPIPEPRQTPNRWISRRTASSALKIYHHFLISDVLGVPGGVLQSFFRGSYGILCECGQFSLFLDAINDYWFHHNSTGPTSLLSHSLAVHAPSSCLPCGTRPAILHCCFSCSLPSSETIPHLLSRSCCHERRAPTYVN